MTYAMQIDGQDIGTQLLSQIEGSLVETQD